MTDMTLEGSRRDPKQYQWSSKLKVSAMSKEQLQQAVCIMMDMMEDVNSRQHEVTAQLEEYLKSS